MTPRQVTEPFAVVWDERAREDWYRLSFDEAEAVAVAVHRFAHGEIAGPVVYGEGEYRLFVGELVVIMLIDADTVYIDRVRHA